MGDEDNQVNENDFDDFADFVSVVPAPVAHDLESLTAADTVVRPEETSLTHSVAQAATIDQAESLVPGNQSTQFPSPAEQACGSSTSETSTSMGLNESVVYSGLRDNGDAAASTIALDDRGVASNLASTDSSDDEGFGSFEDALQDEPESNEDTGVASEAMNHELMKHANECSDTEPISDEVVSVEFMPLERSETRSTQDTAGLSPINDVGNGAVESVASTSAERENMPDLVVSAFKEEDEKEDFGDFSHIDSAENATNDKLDQYFSPPALVSHSEAGDDIEIVGSPNGGTLDDDDDTESNDDDFGDFDEAPPPDHISAEQSGDADDGFGDFDTAPEVNPPASTVNASSPPEIIVVQKANQVFQQLFTRHEDLTYPSDDEPTYDQSRLTIQSILETLEDSRYTRRTYDSGALTAHLTLKSNDPRPTPARLIINEGGGPYSHYSLPLGGIRIRQAGANTRTDASGKSSFKLPDVMNVHLPPSPERLSSIAQSSENGMKFEAAFTSEPNQPKDEINTQNLNAVDENVVEDFIRRIPDLSFMLSSTFVPPNGKPS